MWKKIILLWVLLLSCLGGYGLVFWGNLVFNPEAKFVGSTAKKIYLEANELSSSVVVYQSNMDLSSYSISSSCDISSEFLEYYKTLYFFRVDYSNAPDCKNGNIVLERSGEKLVSSITKLNLSNNLSEISTFIDYSTQDIKNFQKSIESDMSRYAIYKNYNRQSIAKYYKFLKGQRKYKEAAYLWNILTNILVAREQKYTSPVLGGHISEQHSKVPNAARPYRQEYTDGIHHGWDIDGDYGEQIVALDDGIIVRVVNDFDASDLSRIIYGENLSEEQKLKNLDLLRGKQVWLKTMKGEVVFYSHLDTIPSSITEGSFVSQGDALWTTGVTGIPQDGYDDYHLHFSIMKNPYIFENAGTYDFGDYMSWDWLTKGMSHWEVIQAQKNIFE